MHTSPHHSFCHRVTRFISILLPIWLLSTAQLAHSQESTSPPALSEATASAVAQAKKSGNVVIELQTNLGPLHLELFPNKAPKSVANFVSYVESDFYNGTVFHRVIEGFMIQGGGMDLRLEKKETKAPIQNEADNGLKNEKFTVAMARTGDPHSATAQFFINTANNGFLDHQSKTQSGWGYAVIGQLIGGKEIAEWMSKAPTGPAGPFPSDVPVIPLVIEKAVVL